MGRRIPVPVVPDAYDGSSRPCGIIPRERVPQALAELKAGKTVSVATPQPYGCGVKYGS